MALLEFGGARDAIATATLDTSTKTTTTTPYSTLAPIPRPRLNSTCNPTRYAPAAAITTNEEVDVEVVQCPVIRVEDVDEMVGRENETGDAIEDDDGTTLVPDDDEESVDSEKKDREKIRVLIRSRAFL